MFLCGRSVLSGAFTFVSSLLTLLSPLERMGLGLLPVSGRFTTKPLAFAPSVLHRPTREEDGNRDHDHDADDDQNDCECAHSVPSEQQMALQLSAD
jgi:hypothetical protein